MISNLKKLLKNVNFELYGCDENALDSVNINKLTYSSFDATQNDLFVCLKGARFDSHTIIGDVLDAGVKVVVINKEFLPIVKEKYDKRKDVIFIVVKNTRETLASLSINYFDNPAAKLHIIGVTGTKGKTTTSFMIKEALKANGHKVGLIGTLGIIIDDKITPTVNTTPESFVIAKAFDDMVNAGCDYAVMEVSSQALKYHRVDGIIYDYAVWTNIMPEHIGANEHDDFEDYISSKLKIFKQSKNALINSETDYLDRIIDECKKYKVHYIVKDKDVKNLTLSIPGDYNLKNGNMALALSKCLDLDYDKSLNAIENTIVPGRSEVVYNKAGLTIIVDFSYEPTSALNFLQTVNKIHHNRIVAIYGCGGNRSIDRRLGMGEISGKLSDLVILTADNSRYEKTIDIIKDIEKTLSKYKKKDDIEKGYLIIEDRGDAVDYAIKNHKNGDIICVMGKGAEETMEVNGEHIHFNDREEIEKVLIKYNLLN